MNPKQAQMDRLLGSGQRLARNAIVEAEARDVFDSQEGIHRLATLHPEASLAKSQALEAGSLMICDHIGPGVSSPPEPPLSLSLQDSESLLMIAHLSRQIDEVREKEVLKSFRIDVLQASAGPRLIAGLMSGSSQCQMCQRLLAWPRISQRALTQRPDSLYVCSLASFEETASQTEASVSGPVISLGLNEGGDQRLMAVLIDSVS